MSNFIGNIHVVTDVILQTHYTHIELAKLALAGGANVIQYRDKHRPFWSMIADTLAIRELCTSMGASLIINDYIEVALAVNADGVHLGQEDFFLDLARVILGPDKIIGCSAGNLLEVRRCIKLGADYIGFGPVFDTNSKIDAGGAVGIDELRRVIEISSIPIIAIGGISLVNVEDLKKANVYGIAFISAVCCHKDPQLITTVLRDSFSNTLK